MNNYGFVQTTSGISDEKMVQINRIENLLLQDRFSPHAILGVGNKAKENEIVAAYRQLAKQFHPDRCKHPRGENVFKIVSRAKSGIDSGYFK